MWNQQCRFGMKFKITLLAFFWILYRKKGTKSHQLCSPFNTHGCSHVGVKNLLLRCTQRNIIHTNLRDSKGTTHCTKEVSITSVQNCFYGSQIRSPLPNKGKLQGTLEQTKTWPDFKSKNDNSVWAEREVLLGSNSWPSPPPTALYSYTKPQLHHHHRESAPLRESCVSGISVSSYQTLEVTL
jgi:hypothetical protein